MSRTTVEFKFNNDVETTLNTMVQIFRKYGYENKIVNGENVWAKGGIGTIAPLRCFAFYFGEASVVLQGWVYDELFGDQELKGMSGFVVKNKMKSIMNEIGQTI